MSNSSKTEHPEASNNSEQKSPIEFISEVFWEDFEAQRPINGGVLSEDKLRQCQLDGSVHSLRRLDAFLDELRMQWSGKEAIFVQDERSRNLLLFIGFYIGRVLAQAWHVSPQWLSENQVSTRYPHLKVHNNNVYHFMALNYLPAKHQSSHESRHLFFVLEPIAKRLFPLSQQLVTSASGDTIDAGVFDAVFKRLPPVLKEALLEQFSAEQAKTESKTSVDQPQTPQAAVAQSSIADSTGLESVPSAFAKEASAHKTDDTDETATAISKQTVVSKQTVSKDSSRVDATVRPADAKVSTAKVQKIDKPAELIRQDDFTKLRNDLNNIAIEQQQGESLYQQAEKVLSQFDRHIAKLNADAKTLQQIKFSEQQLMIRQQAVGKLNEAAKLGNTAAMLRLAIAYFLGEGADKNIQEGVSLIKKAANADDPRAQRQLSRLYYQGLGVSQDTEQGLYWLETAAENGHKEAKELLEQWHNSQTIIDEHKYDATTDGRYLLLILITVVIAVLIIIMV